jgi:hypothetical protein
LDSLTLAGAKSAGLLSGWGSLVTVFDCLEMLYDDEINCYGKDFYCYDEKTKSVPFGHMSEYLHNCTVEVPVKDGRLWSPQVQNYYYYYYYYYYYTKKNSVVSYQNIKFIIIIICLY